MRKLLSLCSVFISVYAFAQNPSAISMNTMKNSDSENTVNVTADQNPLLAKWSGVYGGVPPFDKVKIADFAPALETAMKENLEEVEKIAGNTEAPTFSNTIAALDLTGQSLERVSTIYGVWSSSMNNAEFQAVETEMAPKLAAFSDQITQNEKLFARIEMVYNSPEKSKLTPEQQRLTWIYYTNFVRAGAKLDSGAKSKMSEINQELAGLYTRFSQNQLADEMDRTVLITKAEDLKGLPQSLIDAAAQAGGGKEKPGNWVIKNTRSSVDPFLTYADNRTQR